VDILLCLVGVAALLGLGMTIGSTASSTEQNRVFGWALASAAFGALVGLSEILTRYRDEPIVASLTSYGLAYLALNAVIALGAFAILRGHPGAIFPVLKDSLFLTATVAGFGAMTIFRAKLFTYKSTDGKEYAIGPAIVLETVLQTIDQKIDRQRSTQRQAKVFAGTDTLHDFEHTANYIEATLGSFQNLTADQKAQISLVIKDIRESLYPDRLKLMGLGFAFLDLAGEENFDLVVTNIQNFIGSLPIPCVYVTGITATSADVIWVTSSNADSQVEYGTDQKYGNSSTLDPAQVTVHRQTLSGLNPRTMYHYRAKSSMAGQAVVAVDHTFRTL
jgi:hypothetical protein